MVALDKNKQTILGLAVLLLMAMLWLDNAGTLPSKAVSLPHSKDFLRLAGIAKSDYTSLQFDKIRELVNAHSRHDTDIVAGSVKNDQEKFAQAYSYAAGDSDTAPSMQSALRAELMQDLLELKGYKARAVTLYSADDFSTHTIVEAYNPRTRQWEAQDPDYNVFFVYTGGTQRASLHDMLEQPARNFQPCNLEGYCSWISQSVEGLDTEGLKPYFAAALQTENGKPVLTINPEKISRDALCARTPQICTGKIIMLK